MFSFYEILSLSTIPLIIYSGTEESYKALYKYLKLLFIPSTFFFLLAIFLIYANFGHSSFIDDTGLFEYIKISEYQVIFILLLFILGIAKLATIPFYSWLSTAMVAIHPVSAILHAVAIVNSGIFCFAKILIYIFGIDYLSEISMGQYLIFIPISTIIFGSIIALYQDSVKKILAYSTIIQMNIMLASLLSFTKIGLIGAITHMVVHSLTKLLLFFKAGDIYIATKANRLEQLRGLSKIMPISYIVMFIASLALAGLPLSPNYFTKKIIASSFSDYTIYVIKISSIFTCIYLTKILYYMSKKQVNNIEIGKIGKMQLLSGYIIFVLIILAAIFISREFVIPFYKLMEEFLIFGLVFLLIILIFRNSHLQFFQKLKSIKILWGYVELIFDKFYSMINKSIINPFNRQIIVAANLSGVNISLYSALILLIIFSLICLCNKFLLV
jgi:multicomponent Na+:H+ antiporter subunit D